MPWLGCSLELGQEVHLLFLKEVMIYHLALPYPRFSLGLKDAFLVEDDLHMRSGVGRNCGLLVEFLSADNLNLFEASCGL